MEKRTWSQFFKEHLFTGLVVLLPISLFVLVVLWLYRIIDGMIEPLVAPFGFSGLLVNIIVVIAALIALFLIGLSFKTKVGNWFFRNLDKHMFSHLPGYKMIKTVIAPFTGSGFEKNFESVALVDIFDNGALMTAFVTEKHDNGYITVFVPTGPNPTSGNIYHIPSKRVHMIQAKVDDVLTSVVAVGAGSKKLLKKYKK